MRLHRSRLNPIRLRAISYGRRKEVSKSRKCLLIVIWRIDYRGQAIDVVAKTARMKPCVDPSCALTRFSAALLCLVIVAACGGGGGGSVDSAAPSGPMAAEPALISPGTSSSPMPTSAPAPVVLPKPVLSFDDTGVSVSDGLTFNGKWSVSSLFGGLGWEWSVDQGRTWIRGEGDSFVVAGDGAKLIWVRTFDGLGNFSEIVMVSCTLDTTMPMQPQVSVIAAGLPTIQIQGLEPMAGWEYSVDEQRTWIRGTGMSLSLAGNHVRKIWSRQIDAAGNASPAVATMLDGPDTANGRVEASNDPMAPTALPRWESTLLLHGEVTRGDADFVRFDVPQGYQLRSMRLVYYDSPDPIAFYALQKAPVFDAGTNVQRMLSWKHLGPPDLLVELLSGVAPTARNAGAYTLWVQQTGVDRTAYAIEIKIELE